MKAYSSSLGVVITTIYLMAFAGYVGYGICRYQTEKENEEREYYKRRRLVNR